MTRTSLPGHASRCFASQSPRRATVTVDEDDFFTRLTHDQRVNVRMRESERNPGQVTGYAVHLAGNTTADGDPIFYSGGKARPTSA